MDRCGNCRRKVTGLHQATDCELCKCWWHRKYTEVSAKDYVSTCKEEKELDFICPTCVRAIVTDEQVSEQESTFVFLHSSRALML